VVEVERDHAQLGVGDLRELVMAAPAAKFATIARDLGRIAETPCRHPVIAGKNEDLDLIETRRAPPLPKAEPGNRLFEAPEAARRLGQRTFAAGHGRRGFGVASGKIETSRAQFVQGSETRHFRVDSTGTGWEERSQWRGASRPRPLTRTSRPA
jgi:hypothetical protein